jgi:glycosyltransferase involved in cell wall biosynthesis
LNEISLAFRDAGRSAAVSVILPTYNRARFLPEAIASIRGQEFADWELIVVDDGSTDETAQLLPKLTGDITQPVRIIRQENQGAYAARNTGLDHARGKYIAFYDSDDLWLPHHLQDCVAALEANADVDWVYGACRLIDADTHRVLAESTFCDGGPPRAFCSLTSERRGDLSVLSPQGLLAKVLGGVGLYAGLQNSVIRADVFGRRRFAVDFYNEAEDQLAVVRAIATGRRLAYLDAVHVDYRIHDGNSSASAKGLRDDKRIRLMEGLVRGYEGLLTELNLTSAERRALKRRLSQQYFWSFGYASLWQCGRRHDAIAAYRKAIRHWPWDWRYWKVLTFGVVQLLCLPFRGAHSA